MRRLASRIVALALGALISGALYAAPRMVVIDSGSTARTIKKLYVVDSGGTTRAIKKLYVIDTGGTARLVYRRALHETTIAIGTNGVNTYGYAVGQFGSIGSSTYTDASGATRLIRAAIWSSSDVVAFALDGAEIPNSNNTFASITIGNTTFTRSSATYNGQAGGGTFSQWHWNTGGAGLPSASSVALSVE